MINREKIKSVIKGEKNITWEKEPQFPFESMNDEKKGLGNIE